MPTNNLGNPRWRCCGCRDFWQVNWLHTCMWQMCKYGISQTHCFLEWYHGIINQSRKIVDLHKSASPLGTMPWRHWFILVSREKFISVLLSSIQTQSGQIEKSARWSKRWDQCVVWNIWTIYKFSTFQWPTHTPKLLFSILEYFLSACVSVHGAKSMVFSEPCIRISTASRP